MTKVVTYVFDNLFERKESVSFREKTIVVFVFAVLAVSTTLLLSFI